MSETEKEGEVMTTKMMNVTADQRAARATISDIVFEYREWLADTGTGTEGEVGGEADMRGLLAWLDERPELHHRFSVAIS